MARAVAPILSHTTEEVWQHLPAWEGKEHSIQLSAWPDSGEWQDDELGERWERDIVSYFEQGDRAVEGLRQQGVVRQPMEAELTLYCAPERWQRLVGALGEDDLAAASGVSQVSYGGMPEQAPAGAFEADGGEPMRIAGRSSPAGKCQRCWRRQASVGRSPAHPQLCGRCVEYLPE